MRARNVEPIELDLDQLMFFEDAALAIEWHALFSIWFTGRVVPAANC